MTLHFNAIGSGASFFEVGPSGGIRAASEELASSVQAPLAELGARVDSTTDDIGNTRWSTYADSLDMVEYSAAEAASQMRARSDSFSANVGGGLNPRELVGTLRRTLEERRPPLNYRAAFDTNTSLPPGLMEYEQYRASVSGTASIYRGGDGSNVGEIELANTGFKAPIVYLIAAISTNWLEQLNINRIGLGNNTTKMRGAIRALQEAENKLTWTGSEADRIYGVLNHPYVDHMLASIDFGTAQPDAMSEAMSTWANYAEEQSGSIFQPDTMLIAPKLLNYIANKRFGSGSDKTVLAHFREAHPHIKRILKVRELNNAGPDGSHYIVFHRKGAGPSDRSIELVRTMGITPLVPDNRPLTSKMFLVCGFGGANQIEVGDALIVAVKLTR